jgi:site-specific DNA recombinase
MGSAYESKRASERSLDELKRRAAAGKVAGGKMYGYKNYRPREGARVERVVDEAQAKIIRKVFELVADGWGYGRIAKYLNAEKIPGPKTLGVKKQNELMEKGESVPIPEWSLSGIRELVGREIYVTGEYIWGQSKRSRKKGSKLRLKRATDDDTIVRVQNDAWKIVEPDLWRRAHERIDAYNAQALRSGVGNGSERTRFVAKPERRGSSLLSGFLRCGNLTPAGKTCSAPMIVSSRGRRGRRHYACSAYKEKGEAACTSKGAVSMAALDAAVVASLRSTFTPEAFERYLGAQAANASKLAEHQATRARLIDEELPRLAKVIERLTKRLAAIDDDDVAAVVQAELKEAVAERKQIEAKVLELEGYVGGLKDQEAKVARLREAWGNWAGALSADPELVVKARSVLKLILSTPIWVRPVVIADGLRCWEFAGVSRYDRVLAGGIIGEDYRVEDRPAVDPEELFVWFLEAAGDIPRSQPEAGTWTYGRVGSPEVEIELLGDVELEVVRPISGGSDTPAGVSEGWATSGPPS